MSEKTGSRRTLAAAVSGPIAAFAALCVAELVAAAVRPEAGPVAAVGGAVVDRTPAVVKDFAIRTFGTADKLVLQIGILTVLAVFALAVGLLSARHRRTAALLVAGFGVLGAWIAVGRPDGRLLDALPSLAGGLAGCAVLLVLTSKLGARPSPAAEGKTAAPGGGHAGSGTGNVGSPSDPARPGGAGSAASAPPAAPSGREGPPTAGAAPSHPAGSPETVPEHSAGKPTMRPDAYSTHGTSGSQDTDRPRPAGSPGFDRRAFVVAASASVAASAGAGLLGRHLNSGRQADASAARSRIDLPAPAERARPLPGGTELSIPGVAPFTTPNRDFYRVDTALVVPRVDATRWRLKVHGRGVRSPLSLSFDDLLKLPLIERDITLTCVSNQVGGPYVGNARWIGVRLADVLRDAGVRPPSRGGPADQLVARSVDGMTLGSPVETVMDGRDALLALGMNGEPLPFDHGFPVRMVVPGLYGYVSACKWLQDLELTTFDDFDAYWVRRKWAREAPIKTQSRIDTPRPLASPKAGPVTVAGVAWAQHRGIARVQVRVDGGPWQDARLAAEAGRDTWRQWTWPWTATPGNHTLEVRATDREGDTQTERRVGTVPDGATGLHSVVVAVT
ncbi:molybdopterin-dependent oxidoreductase [Streptomyces candidus]|uniref:DMSO/TMAO reductase YedYZ molybdopterin-dependent catalytic subunit n=1 Tax=Streptomyces candidus TaxID=67283 RepID=A0A7X0HHU2_9ACTN|nr:DMSO/TMAO reductase YedYZ molybdopterin-dependent catalytic subunit [Streptomyces candidus]